MKFNFFKTTLIFIIISKIVFLIRLQSNFFGAGVFFVFLIGIIKNKRWASIIILIFSIMEITEPFWGYTTDFRLLTFGLLMLLPAYKEIIRLSPREKTEIWELSLKNSFESLKQFPKEFRRWIKDRENQKFLVASIIYIIIFILIYKFVFKYIPDTILEYIFYGFIITVILSDIINTIRRKYY